MNKIFTLISSALLTFTVSAQQLTNNSFETWVSGNPTGWSTSHSCIAASTLESQSTTSIYQGNSSIKLMTGTVSTSGGALPYPGFAHYGTAAYDNNAQDFTMNGVAFPYKPDSIQFAYKYSPVSGDSASVLLYLYKTNIGSAIGVINRNLGATSSYRLVTLPVSYTGSQIPDSMIFTFYAGDLAVPHSGSVLNIDAVKFLYHTAESGVENIYDAASVKVYPNPVSSKIHINMSDKMVGCTVKIYNVLGSEMTSTELKSNNETIDVSAFEEGIYIYRIFDPNQKGLMSGKFNKQ